jgi:hypothetical protein
MMTLNPNIKIKSPLYLVMPFIVLGLIVIVSFGYLITSSFSKGYNCATNGTHVTGNLTTTNVSNGEKQTTNVCDTNSSTANIASLVVTSILYLAFFISFIFFVIWEWSYAHAVDAITGEKLSFAMTLLVLLLVPDGIDILIVQEYFNKLGDVLPPSAQPPMNSQPPIDIQPPAMMPPSSPIQAA